MSRLPDLRPELLDREQARLYRRITTGPRGGGPFALVDEDGRLRGPFAGYLLSPPVGEALQRLGAAIRYETSLPPRLRELAILMVAHHWDSAFERDAHEAVGRTVGLTDDEMRSVGDGRVPPLDGPIERAGCVLTAALLTGDVDDATWATCAPPLTERDVHELTSLVGYYATLALQMRVFRVAEHGR